MQAALHADELPGVAVLHYLICLLAQAEAENRIAGDITLVPQANPAGAAQFPFSCHQGRFDLASRTNFNRDFPRIALGLRHSLLEDLDELQATDALKRLLLHEALGHDIVLDLHCDSESVHYAYFCEGFWPAASDLAAALQLDAVFLADGESSAFEEAVAYAFGDGNTGYLAGKLVSTLELRGQLDVDEGTARSDAAGLMRFLAARKVILKQSAPLAPWTGPVVPLDNIDIIRAPQSGAILFHKAVGETVKQGDLLVSILHRPGHETGTVDMTAPQDGLVATRCLARFAHRQMPLMKILYDRPTGKKRPPGALSD